jgi:hypothetical protein
MGAERVSRLNSWSAVDNLWFPVKLWVVSALFLMPFLGLACGYRPAYGGRAVEGERLAVVTAPPLVGDVGAIESVLAGAREELARAGRLRSGDGYPRLVVEVIRLDEVAAGIVAEGASARARGTSVAVAGRAWIERAPDAAPARDTGDMQRAERYAPETDLRVEGVRYDQAVRSAGRELGRALALRALGHPTPATEPP